MFRAGTLVTLLAAYTHSHVRPDPTLFPSGTSRTSTAATSTPFRPVMSGGVSGSNYTSPGQGCNYIGSSSNAANNSSHLVYPYPVEGRVVPIYSMVHGRVQRRNWVFRNPQWCDLCREPVDHWLNHLSRKDHALLDLHYTAHLEWPRRWSPQQLLACIASTDGSSSSSSSSNAYSSGSIPRPALPVSMLSCYQHYAHYEKMHRSEVYAMLVELKAAGVVHCGDVKDTYLARMQGGLRGMDNQGALVLHELLLGPFNRLYPDGHIQDFSNLLDFITCSYNLETVYDLCGLYTIDTIAIQSKFKASSPAALGLGGISTSSSPADGYERAAELPPSSSPATAFDAARVEGSRVGEAAVNGSSTLPSAAALAGLSRGCTPHAADVGERESARARFLALRTQKQQRDREEEAFSRKAVFMRQVLGQLRWTILPGQQHPTGRIFAPHLIELGELCLRAIVVELILVRVCEYMMRAEPVWFAFGFERRRLPCTLVKRHATITASALWDKLSTVQANQTSSSNPLPFMSCDSGERSDGVVPIMQRWHYRCMSSNHDDLFCIPKQALHTESRTTSLTSSSADAEPNDAKRSALGHSMGSRLIHMATATTRTETSETSGLNRLGAVRGGTAALSTRGLHRLTDNLFRPHPVPRATL